MIMARDDGEQWEANERRKSEEKTVICHGVRLVILLDENKEEEDDIIDGQEDEVAVTAAWPWQAGWLSGRSK